MSNRVNPWVTGLSQVHLNRPLHCKMFVVQYYTRVVTIFGREIQLQLHKTKIAITEIKAVKLCRNHNLIDLSSHQLAPYISEVFDQLLERGKRMVSVGMRIDLPQVYFQKPTNKREPSPSKIEVKKEGWKEKCTSWVLLVMNINEKVCTAQIFNCSWLLWKKTCGKSNGSENGGCHQSKLQL